MWLVRDQAGAVMGLVGLHQRPDGRGVGLRFAFTQASRGKGLAREAGARLGERVYSDSLSAPDGPAATYLDMMRHNTALFAAAMREG